jgi:(p)ppGpp synthase/HD superfamily hydrolase
VTRKLKDFIAIPQSNAYRAIHTSVIGPSGEPIKFYIRTREMDALDESGFVRMGLLGREKVREFNKKLGLLKRSFSEDMKEEPKTAVEMVSSDLDDIMIFFDKNGKPFEMPANSTSLDFAFSLSSSRGLRFSYALVNGKRVPPWYEIQPSDIVEIVTLKKPQARKEWLEFVRLKKSKKSILDYLARGRRKQKKRETEFVTIKVSALDRVGLFHAIADVFAANKVNISSISAGSDGTRKSANMLFKIEIGSPKQLSMLLKRLNAIKSVTRTEIVASEKKRQKGYSM